MPRAKKRDKRKIEVDMVLCIKLNQFRKQWESMFDEPISEIEMTKIFGEFGKIDLNQVKRYKGGKNVV
jgi:hypothetical protein